MPKQRKHVSQLSERTLKQNGKRYKDRLKEPEMADLPRKAPKHLSEAQQTIWADLVRRVPKGVLKSLDTFALELTVYLLEKLRAGKLSASESGQLRGCLASIGATPADRSRVKAPPSAPVKSELDRILDGDDENETGQYGPMPN